MNTPTLDRRTFLKISTTGAAGLMLGFRLADDGMPGDAFEPNVWLSIGTNSVVTITVAKQEMGQGVLTSLPMIIADELDADWSNVRVLQADAHPSKYGSQSTGGSSSVRTSYTRLRQAGAAARAMLVSAAAKRWKVSEESCSTANGFVLHAATKRRLAYGLLTFQAAKLPVPENPPLKDPKAFTLIGKPTKRIDSAIKTNGSAKYGIDARVPGMVFASVTRAPRYGATIESYDASSALAYPGVLDVVRIDSGIAVLASTTWAAFEGRQRLHARWTDGDWSGQSSDAIWSLFEKTAETRGEADRTVGDPEARFAGAAHIVEATYRAPLIAHATMEPMNCTADVQPDRCEIWAPTQRPQQAQAEAARITGLPIDAVTVHVMQLGGGFGRRLQIDYVTDAVQVSKAIGKPVQVIWRREDDMTHDFYRPCTLTKLRAALDAKGNVIAWTSRVVGPSSKGLVVPGAFPEYDIPDAAVDYHIVETGVPVGAWRSVGASQNVWVVESFMDELAAEAKADPLEYRLRFLANHPRQARALKTAAEKAGWGKSLPAGVARGIAVGEDFGSVVAEVAEVSIERGRVKVHRIVAAVDCGPYVNPLSIEAQVQGAIAYGLSAALKGEITVRNGLVEQQNFDAYPVFRIDDMPKVEVHLIESDAPMGGIGEPGLPPASPAVCNAIFKLTGKRVRKLPVRLS